MTGPQQQLASGLQRAVQNISRGEFAAAVSELDGLARVFGRHPDILQIKGVALRRMGRNHEAVDLFRQSLALNPRQPHVHNNLGGALVATGLASEAEPHYRRAIELKPDYTEARYNLALMLLDKDPGAARTLLLAVTAATPNFGPAWEALSIALGKLDDTEGAMTAAQRSVTLSPQSHTAHHNLGHAAAKHQDHVAAERAYRTSLALQPGSDAGWVGLGNALRSQERNDEAIAAMERAVAANPSNIDAHRILNELLWQTGRGERYLQSFAQAVGAVPHDSALRTAFAHELLRIPRADDALRVLESLAPDARDTAQIEDLRARAHGFLGDMPRALQHHERAVARAPGDTLIARNHVETLLKSGRHDEALRACERSLALAPLDQGMLAMFTTALRLNKDERAHALADFQSLARVYAIDPPPGFGSMEDFNEALAAELRKLHTTRAHPTDQTLRGGTQTFGALFDRREPLVQLLKVQLEKAIAGYIGEMGTDVSHPLFRRRGRSFGFSGSWSVRLSEGGFHTNHFHPMGWISSAYYVTVPDEAADTAAKKGWFKLGETNLGLGEHEKIERHVQARPGHLVLFPSYFWHGTVPFDTRDERITVAFDVVPVA
jgi:uncharacterized protein (TIGR02466 family)